MANHASEGRRSGLRRRNLPSPARTNRPSHFFRIIFPSSIRDKKLEMPKNFVMMFGQELSSNALITVPNGGVWQVGLEKANGQIWFCDGWSKFIDYYSIDCGFLLVFRYGGHSTFQVLIFDTTTSEIQYPHDDGMDLGDAVQISGDSVAPISSSCGYSDRHIEDGSSYREHAPKKTSCSSRLENDVSENSLESYDVGTRKKSKRKLEILSCGIKRKSKRCKVEEHDKVEDFDVKKNDSRQKLPSQTRIKTSDGQEMAIRAATKKLKTKNPSFMVIMQKRNIEKTYVYIPSSFSNKYLSSKDEIIELQAGFEGRKWEIYCYGTGRTSKRMGRGWREFSRENNLRAGDVIVFELVERSRINVLDFTVFSSAEK